MKLVREKAGVVSPGPCWVLFDGPWMYGPADTLFQLAREVVTGWRSDRNLVGH